MPAIAVTGGVGSIIFGPTSNSAALNALLSSTDVVFAGAMAMAHADQKVADSLLNDFSVAEDGECLIKL